MEMEQTISREELCNKYKECDAELKALKSTKYDYKVSMPLNGMGLVRKMSMNDLIIAFGVVNEYNNVKKAAMEALEITDNDFSEAEDIFAKLAKPVRRPSAMPASLPQRAL